MVVRMLWAWGMEVSWTVREAQDPIPQNRLAEGHLSNLDVSHETVVVVVGQQLRLQVEAAVAEEDLLFPHPYGAKSEK